MAGEAKAELAEMFTSMGYASSNKIIGLVQAVIWDELREEFHRLLSEGNLEIWQDAIVMEKFDQAVRAMKGKS